MLGLNLRHIKLTPKDRKSLDDQWRRIQTWSKQSQGELFDMLKERVPRDEVQLLQFGLTESGQERLSSKKILMDDSELYARFGATMNIVGRSAIKMRAFDLRDKSQFVGREIANTIRTIINILEQNGYNPPKDHPDFPKLEEELDKETQDFLSGYHPEEDVTDFPSQDLVYIVRNIVIFGEMQEMVEKLKDDIGKITQ